MARIITGTLFISFKFSNIGEWKKTGKEVRRPLPIDTGNPGESVQAIMSMD
jgi:hypothetical protein